MHPGGHSGSGWVSMLVNGSQNWTLFTVSEMPKKYPFPSSNGKIKNFYSISGHFAQKVLLFANSD